MDHTRDLASSNAVDENVLPRDGERISAFLPEFLDYLRVEKTATAITLIRYQRVMERFSRIVRDCDVRAINSECASIYKRRLMDKGLSPVTIGIGISVLRSFLRYLRDIRGLQVYEPEKIRRPKIPKREIDYLKKDELRRFRDAIPISRSTGLRDRALIEVLCSTGMRISEVLSLNREQIDWDRREARIIGKGNKERYVYFTEEALDWLRRYLEFRQDDNTAVFVSDHGSSVRLRAGGTWKRFHYYAKRAGLSKRVYPHMLRHTMATILLANGCPIGHIRSLLGHEHLNTTCRYYLGVISNSEVKVSHSKYLSYESDEGERTDGNYTRRENTRHDLTEKRHEVELA